MSGSPAGVSISMEHNGILYHASAFGESGNPVRGEGRTFVVPAPAARPQVEFVEEPG